MSESNQKPSAGTTCSKSQAFDLEALQIIVTSTTKIAASIAKTVATLSNHQSKPWNLLRLG
eukprot:scaffold150419_cov59-Attheya_sp.AAC.5